MCEKTKNNILIQYIRTPKKLEARVRYKVDGPQAYLVETGNNPYGVIVAVGRGQVGWSLCSSKDKFKPIMGKKIAEQRAGIWGNRSINEIISKAPRSIQQSIMKMYNRSLRYYK